MRTRWTVPLILGCALTGMLTASLLQRAPFHAMPLRELTAYVERAMQDPSLSLHQALAAYRERLPQGRRKELESLLADPEPAIRRAAAMVLRFEDFAADDEGPNAPAAHLVDAMLAGLGDDAVSLPILFALTGVCDAHGWQELPPAVAAALRRHLSARAPAPPEGAALFCMARFGRIAMPLQPELLAIDPARCDSREAVFLANALAAIAPSNGAVVDRLVELLAPRSDGDTATLHVATRALGSCGPAAKSAVPRLLELIDTPGDADLRRSAAAAVADVTADPEVAERALHLVMRDRMSLTALASGPQWAAAASRLTMHVPHSAFAVPLLQTLDTMARMADQPEGARATYAAARALVAAELGDAQERDAALAEAHADLTTTPAGLDDGTRFARVGDAIELLIDLHRAHPDVPVDLVMLRHHLEVLGNARATRIRDWAVCQRSRLPR